MPSTSTSCWVAAGPPTIARVWRAPCTASRATWTPPMAPWCLGEKWWGRQQDVAGMEEIHKFETNLKLHPGPFGWGNVWAVTWAVTSSQDRLNVWICLNHFFGGDFGVADSLHGCFDVCCRTWWVIACGIFFWWMQFYCRLGMEMKLLGAGPILIYVHPTGRLRVPQLMSPKVGITIRMAHAQYGMLDQVDALKRSLQNKKLGWFRIWTLPLKFCQGIWDPGLQHSPILSFAGCNHWFCVGVPNVLLWGCWGWRWEEKVHGGLSMLEWVSALCHPTCLFTDVLSSYTFHVFPSYFHTWNPHAVCSSSAFCPTFFPSQEVAACPWPTGQWQDHDATRSGASAWRGVSASRGHRGHLQWDRWVTGMLKLAMGILKVAKTWEEVWFIINYVYREIWGCLTYVCLHFGWEKNDA